MLQPVDAIRRDLRYAWRSLAAQPGWTLAAVLCLALGTGPNTAAFSIVNGVLLRPLPFPDAQQLVMVAIQEADRAQTRPFAFSEYRDIAPELQPVADVAARTFAPVALAAGDESRMVEAELVSGNYFDMLRIIPAAGRFPRRDDERGGEPPEAVISYALWQRRFNGDPAIVGRAVRINSQPLTISGVAPAGFVGATRLIATDLWLPASLGHTLARTSETTPQYGAIARLRPGVSMRELRARLDAVLSRRARNNERPASSVVVHASGFGVPPAVRGTVAGAAALLFGVIALVTGVAVANVASLMLARATDRRREIGVRVALGAEPRHVARQVLAESLMLALAGSAAGVLLATWGVRALAALAPASGQPAHVAFAIDVSLEPRVLLYAIVAAIVVAALFGVAPARYASRTDVIDALKGASGSGRPPATARALMTIVVGQIAVSTTLLVGAGLLARTYLNTIAVEPGVETRNILAVSLDLDQLRGGEHAARRIYDDIVRRVSLLPEVEATSLSRERPLTFSGSDAPVWIEDATGTAGSAVPRDAGALVVTPDYFGMLGIRLVQGRLFDAAERSRPLVAVINETMARRFWPGESPVGRRFHVGQGAEPIVVIGVVADVKYRSLTEAPRPVFYQPYAQQYSAQMSLLVRSRAEPGLLSSRIEREIHAAYRDLAITDNATLDERLEIAVAPRRQRALFLLVLCAFGLLLSCVGLHGVIAYDVRRRARELGIRIALGARRRGVVLMVVGQGLRLAVMGLALGFAISFAATRAIASMLYGVAPYDPATRAATAAIVAAVTLAAVYLPARWATHVDPVVALREE